MRAFGLWSPTDPLRTGRCVVGKQVIEVRVGMVRACAVLQRILHEADAVQADPREGGRVRATG
jgi:hypothetical protein